ncbi:HAMP domain-containing sensor histidine kinase [Ruminococcus sp.]|uniref:sensor histidine kinase n=1 Tax=Ruminococcus sp. TaxID=41978 RepID=UPI0025E4025F|nr:HAMP domain-containing sensor histidine kinase [Ruminococcus sp.]MBQ8965422.1 HAMP domain-containing histidine kinase [Ruminococcus sp.]
MKIIEALKVLYADSDEKVIFTDTSLMVRWRSSDDLPDWLDTEKMRPAAHEYVHLPITEKLVCRYFGDNCEMTMSITPMSEDGEQVGYLIHCLNEKEVDTLAMQSTLKDRLRNCLDAIRFQTGSILGLLSNHKEHWAERNIDDIEQLNKDAYSGVIKVMAATANYEEISVYLGDSIRVEEKFISAVLADLSERVRIRAEQKGYIFESDVKEMVHMKMNTARLEAALSNLIVNAYMYNHKPEKICRLNLIRKDGEVILAVTDNGDGIPEEKLKKLKEPLVYNSNNDLNESLGLTVAMLYCQRFGGRLEIESEVGKYTTVKMIFKDPGKYIPGEFRQYYPPIIFALDNTGCILGKCFGYYNDDTYSKKKRMEQMSKK